MAEKETDLSLRDLQGQLARSEAAYTAGDYPAALAAVAPLIGRYGPQPDWTASAARAHLALGHHDAALSLILAGLTANARAVGLWRTAAAIWAKLGNSSLQAACLDRVARLQGAETPAGPVAAVAGGVPDAWRRLLAGPLTRPTVGACMIVRDESRLLPACLASLDGVDQLVVVDTGSTDATVAIAEGYGAQLGHFVWCDDFAAARNAALALMTTDWILIIDADERLGGGLDALRQTVDDHGYGGVIFAPLSHMAGDTPGGGSRDRASRLFARRSGRQFHQTIHEAVADADGKPLLPWFVDSWHLVHYGYTSDRLVEKDKGGRNMRLLEARLAAQPDDAEAAYYLGVEYRFAGRSGEARMLLERYLVLRPGGSRTAATVVHLLRALDGLHDDAGMIRLGEAQQAICGHLPDFWLMLGLAHARRDDRAAARACFERARQDAGQRGEYETEGARTWQPTTFLAQLSAIGGDWPAVLSGIKAILPEAGPQPLAHQLYLQALMALGQIEVAVAHCEHWLNRPDAPEVLTEVFAAVLERSGPPGQQILACFSDWPGGFAYTSHRLMAAQAWEALLAHCETWIPVVGAPAEAQAGIVHLILGEPIEAKAAFRRAVDRDAGTYLAWHNLG
ncbi:MAG: glycosyltransferase family 2 protein, partial [Candidatus Sericytochromatia bacterium]|nr:glycosyltransferase family 2 protein [Candidatus Sericytochromatia bacterium]